MFCLMALYASAQTKTATPDTTKKAAKQLSYSPNTSKLYSFTLQLNAQQASVISIDPDQWEHGVKYRHGWDGAMIESVVKMHEMLRNLIAGKVDSLITLDYHRWQDSIRKAGAVELKK